MKFQAILTRAALRKLPPIDGMEERASVDDRVLVVAEDSARDAIDQLLPNVQWRAMRSAIAKRSP